MDISFSSVAGTTIQVHVLDSSPLSDVSRKIAKRINSIPESIIFYLHGKVLDKRLTVNQLPLSRGDTVMFQSSINMKPRESARFAFEDINDTVELIDAQRQIFSSKDVLKASKAIYSKEHMSPQEKRKSDPENFLEMVEELTSSLGYNAVKCANALRRSQFCIDLAASLLMDNQDGVQEIMEIIEIMEDMREISLDNQIDSIEKKPATVVRSSLAMSAGQRKMAPQGSKSKMLKTPETPTKKSLLPQEGGKKVIKTVLQARVNGGVAPARSSVLRSSLPPLRK